MARDPAQSARPCHRRRLRHQRRGGGARAGPRAAPIPATIVVIDERERRCDAAEACGATVLEGDATRNATLEAVRIDARARADRLGRARRHLDPDRADRAAAGARRADQRRHPLRGQRGARAAGGRRHGHQSGQLRRPAARRLDPRRRTSPTIMADLAAADGRVALHERPVTPEEVGRPLSAIATGLGVRVYRGEHGHGFWDDAAHALRPGDLMIEIVRNGGERHPSPACPERSRGAPSSEPSSLRRHLGYSSIDLSTSLGTSAGIGALAIWRAIRYVRALPWQLSSPPRRRSAWSRSAVRRTSSTASAS